MKISPNVLKVELPLIALSLAIEIAAIGAGEHAASLMDGDCDARNAWHIYCVLFGVTGVITAITYLVFAIRQKRFKSLIAAILLTVTCIMMAIAAAFTSIFCLTF
ncbi:MAG TPA: hypothetical protein VLG47_03685 [Candidatus Saccharimonadales bacterium]|nr:hypothetical protein [Candidatus Saccharimonadales bacterium]